MVRLTRRYLDPAGDPGGGDGDRPVGAMAFNFIKLPGTLFGIGEYNVTVDLPDVRAASTRPPS